MSSTFRTRWSIVLLAAGGILVAGWAGLKAADEKSDSTKPAAKDSGKDENTESANKDAANKDPFAVPEGKPDDLLKFIQKTEKSRPTRAKSQEDVIGFFTKSRKAIIEAADKILAAEADDKTRVAAIKSKLGALGLLEQVRDPDAPKQLKDLLDQIKNDKQPEVARLAKVYGLKLRMNGIGADPAAAAKLWDDIKTELNAAPDDKEMIMLAAGFASGLERRDPERAAQALTELSGLLSKSKDPQIAEMAKKFEGTVRRLMLMGKPLEIKGRLVDGKDFDPASLKGKVVLLDFWATWCGPCRAELPNVKQNYEKYRDKGFEVVGVSLDNDKDVLSKFLADEKIPWPILYSDDEKAQAWENPLATYYGITAIPTVILTNQKGEVVSLIARGPELSNKLAELLGKADEKTAKSGDSESPK